MTDLDVLMAEIEAQTQTIGLADLNPMQRRAVEDYRDARVSYWQEVKKFEVTRSLGGVFVYMIVGVPGDEGTAALTVRGYYHILVGPRGKIRVISED